MRAEQRPPTAGIVAAASYLVVVFLPYVALTDAEAAGIGPYYNEYGIAGPQFLSLLAVVAVVLFAAGRERRTEPDFVAGLTLVLGAVFALLALAWAITVPGDVVASLGEASWLSYHRWLVAASSAAIAACAAWYARVLGLV